MNAATLCTAAVPTTTPAPRRVLVLVRTADNRRFEVEMCVPTTFDAYDAAISRFGAHNLARVEVKPLPPTAVEKRHA